ncbi:MAG: GIY-YIG nuclease family protein, partial [Candidatus Nealsonbacteria bacterium]|nr:GIY-YIG nuclease family protein [Candidatus Nealsonbacteria bacterium]
MDIFRKAKKLPDSPGVYIFLSKDNRPLYIGRTISLRKRVLSYFRKDIDSRIREMVDLAKKIKIKKTDSLLEAVILEANLIKKYWPKYNVRDKDNRSFVYVVIPKADYSEPYVIRGRELESENTKNAHIFGPYQSASLLFSALKIIRRIFPYSTCKPLSGKPCFDYQIGLCPGLCIGKISKDDYVKNIRNIVLLLSGKKKRLMQKLKKENPDKLKSLKHIQDVSLLLKEELSQPEEFSRIEGYDISHLSGKETFGSMVVFLDSRPDKKEYRLFRIKSAPKNDDLRALEEVLTRRLNHKEWKFPDLILIDGGKPQIDFVYKSLKKRKINIPIVGISKYGGDKLVHPSNIKAIRVFAERNKGVLLKVREEAHRLSL